jgi:hypothetical protein
MPENNHGFAYQHRSGIANNSYHERFEVDVEVDGRWCRVETSQFVDIFRAGEHGRAPAMPTRPSKDISSLARNPREVITQHVHTGAEIQCVDCGSDSHMQYQCSWKSVKNDGPKKFYDGVECTNCGLFGHFRSKCEGVSKPYTMVVTRVPKGQ